MNDPTAVISAPPPRYLLESDSSDEEGQGEYAASSSRRGARSKSSPEVRINWEGAEAQKGLKEVVIGVGQSGRYLRRRSGGKGSEKAAVVLTLGGEEVGRGWVMKGTLLMVLEEAEGDEAWRIVEKVTAEVKAERWTVVSAYVPSMYIPDPERDSRSSSQPPVRHFAASPSSSKSAGIASWDSPNYLTGLPGAFVSTAAHPASALDSASLSTILLPLPLSGIDSTSLSSAFDSAAPALANLLTAKQKSSEARWDEADDEPFSAPGMGGGRRSGGRGGAAGLGKEEVSSMYM